MTLPTYEEAVRFMFAVKVDQHFDLTGPWQGWKIRQQYLVSPMGDRIMMRELIGMLIHYRNKFGHHQNMASRRKKASQPEGAAPSNVVSITHASFAKAPPPQPGRVQGGALRGA